ncbi:serine hydrolase [Lacrimispora sp. 210928-DFI.3.58]|uniref:serine hydrolase n=1 Tax=Lacrimispora sp. 210928-DFI.3.58 TaxID=2883214 RepID=UPI001D081BD3|nr:serine hydrolase [Lacrimispora sp. 210928-DFI.3.58]MCB7319041.1 serine hydrolase [Lacrimispora sp. 210928-DFI.3.58]
MRWLKRSKQITRLLLASMAVSVLSSFSVLARPDWPSDTGIQSEAGIVIDMDSGTVLFGQNIHEQKIPASITKILTALVVIENSSMEDMVTFSHDAVYNVEEGSGNKLNLEEGDVLSVRDCLYVMLLQSSNQAANALAEHVAGSREAFADKMNEKALEIGCRESHFANPSGLNDDTQRTSAYDMALIARAAYQNEQLLEINSTVKASLPPTINNPEGRTYSMEHQLLSTEDPSGENYYPDAIAGKTGYTSQAGQTLVTYARRGDRGEIAVTLKSTDFTHYSDTKTILDFGFARFKNVSIAENETACVTGEEPFVAGSESYDPSELYLEESAVITIPNNAEFSDAEMSLEALPENHPKQAVAKLVYTYNERRVGEAWLFTTRPVEPDALEAVSPAGEATPSQAGTGEALPGDDPPGTDTGDKGYGSGFQFPPAVFLSASPAAIAAAGIGAAVLLLAAAGFLLYRHQRKREEELKRIQREKRLKRLADIGCSEEEFERLLNERRQRHHE